MRIVAVLVLALSGVASAQTTGVPLDYRSGVATAWGQLVAVTNRARHLALGEPSPWTGLADEAPAYVHGTTLRPAQHVAPRQLGLMITPTAQVTCAAPHRDQACEEVLGWLINRPEWAQWALSGLDERTTETPRVIRYLAQHYSDLASAVALGQWQAIQADSGTGPFVVWLRSQGEYGEQQYELTDFCPPVSVCEMAAQGRYVVVHKPGAAAIIDLQRREAFTAGLSVGEVVERLELTRGSARP